MCTEQTGRAGKPRGPCNEPIARLLKLRLESTVKHHTGMIVIKMSIDNALFSSPQFIMIERRIVISNN